LKRIADFFEKPLEFFPDGCFYAGNPQKLSRHHLTGSAEQVRTAIKENLEEFLTRLGFGSLMLDGSVTGTQHFRVENNSARMIFVIDCADRSKGEPLNDTALKIYGVAATLPASELDTSYNVITTSLELAEKIKGFSSSYLPFSVNVFQYDVEKGSFCDNQIYQHISKYAG
jgi:hypothetical protein